MRQYYKRILHLMSTFFAYSTYFLSILLELQIDAVFEYKLYMSESPMNNYFLVIPAILFSDFYIIHKFINYLMV